MFYLQLLLIIKSNIPEFTLENFTDEPIRAAKGIYSPLKINKLKEKLKEEKGFSKRNECRKPV